MEKKTISAFRKYRFSNKPKIFDELLELYQLVEGCSEKQLEENHISNFYNVAIFIPISFVKKDNFPKLFSLLHDPDLKQLMNSDVFRFLVTDPTIKDPDATSGVLDRIYPHIDKNFNLGTPKGSLNLAVINCTEETTVSWHHVDKNDKDIQEFEWVDILYRNAEDSVYEQMNLLSNEAVLIKTDIYHSVYNQSGKKRVVAGWHSLPGVEWDDLVEIVQKKRESDIWT